MAKPGNGTIIIKKVKKGGHGGHHGGAWKVAYADFVTAMMAFFLLLWLLNVTTDVQKRGIADYFEPSISLKSDTSGSGGILGGQALGKPGALTQVAAAPSVSVPIPEQRQLDDGDEGEEKGDPRDMEDAGDPKKSKDPGDPGDPAKSNTNAADTKFDRSNPNADPSQNSGTPNADQNADQGNPGTLGQDKGNPGTTGPGTGNPGTADAKFDKLNDAAAQKAAAQLEDKQFAAAEFALRQAIQDIPDLKDLAQNLLIDRTREGLRIQLVDQDKVSMFPLGSSEMAEPARKLMALVTQIVQRTNNKISITGHTDSTPFARSGGYGNWELSTDRANASRRALIANGLPADRIDRVIGVADRDPLIKDQPDSPSNRRISIVLIRETKPAPGSLAQR
ncbi:MAG: OmpA family protein [Alphaproteobacteria bacterium]|nr:OmpA family protein [Alphaproteobacteria bacterium]